MIELLTWISDHGEKIGVIAVLMIVIAGLVWVNRTLYEEKKNCEEDRLRNREEIGVIKGDVKALTAKVETQDLARQEHLQDIDRLHKKVLEAVAMGRNH